MLFTMGSSSNNEIVASVVEFSKVLIKFVKDLNKYTHGSVLGLVGLIDAKGIDGEQAKNAIFVFLGCFCPYVGQPHSHIG